MNIIKFDVFITSDKFRGEEIIDAFYGFLNEYDDSAQMVISGNIDELNQLLNEKQ